MDTVTAWSYTSTLTKTSHELATSHSLSAWWLVIPKSCVLLIKLVSSLSQETYFTRKYLCCHRSENGVTSIKCTNFLHRRHSNCVRNETQLTTSFTLSQHLQQACIFSHVALQLLSPGSTERHLSAPTQCIFETFHLNLIVLYWKKVYAFMHIDPSQYRYSSFKPYF